MTSFVATESVTVVADIHSVLTKESDRNYDENRKRRHIFKPKDNTYKHKCDKVLRRKLKKYKLRQDGREDQEVIDVSKILVSSLIIKSPSDRKDPIKSEGYLWEFEDLRPKNYLFKMVRRKETVKIKEKFTNSNIVNQNNMQNVIIDVPLSNINQEKKQKNAFKLLMDSRSKIIGSNSPGKDKSDGHSDIDEAVEKKDIKAKRHLWLQKMAEAKGSIRNKEIEVYQDKVIKKEMEKRAIKLKSMILKDSKSVKENEDSNDTIIKKSHDSKFVIKDEVEVRNNINLNIKTKTLRMVDIFDTVDEPMNNSSQKKYIPKEDQEFLKKLSPSIKKKESMLCYLKKVENESVFVPVVSENDNVIKVKLQPRNKKRGKKKKLSLKRSTLESCEVIEINEENIRNNKGSESNELNKKSNDKYQEIALLESSLNDNDVVKDLNSERQKRKRNYKVDAIGNYPENNNEMLNTESRPKRSVKRPVKYIDDACISSSDEELHIFTPKKKKLIENGAHDQNKVNLKSTQSHDTSMEDKSKKKGLKDSDVSKKSAKLAPIFTPKQTDLAALEAKQKFLQSGVPDQLKKIIKQQKNKYTIDSSFPVVVHVQQRDITHEENKEWIINVPLMTKYVTEEVCKLTYEEDAFKKLLQLNEVATAYNININSKKNTQTMLQNIKQLHPKFPVYRTYRYLRGKGKGEFKDCNVVDIDNSIEIMNNVVDVINDSPDILNWTDKYKAMSTNHIIGNFESIKELRKWLISWAENELMSKTKSKPGSDSSDYYQSDTDSRDSMKTMNNLLILTGPSGCGKTASVYAVAAELAMKVIEVNASSKRTGKIMLQDLQEATQSHKVNRGTGNNDNSQKSQEKNQPILAKKIKKQGRPRKYIDNKKTKHNSGKPEVSSGLSLSQDNTRTDSSLILIDDADIVFDQDDGFSAAIVQLVQCSKRPVILVTSSLVCSHLQRFLQYGKILKMCPLSPRMLGTWLDIMCIADSGICWPGVGAKFLNYFKGDIRKAINYLQFYIPSYVHGVTDEETVSQNIDLNKVNFDEESSSMSWPDNEDSEERTIILPVVNNNIDTETDSIWKDFVDIHSNLSTFTYPVQLFNIWWSLPRLLSIKTNIGTTIDDISQSKKKKANSELEAMAYAIDSISLSDYISHSNPDSNTDITSQPWYYPAGHSVSEQENFNYYRKEYETTDEICYTMVSRSIATAQDALGCDRKMDLSFPGMTLHRERDRLVSRHKSLTSYLNVSAVLDRRAIALDYWPSCRTICRFEKSKNDSNIKRNNRFCHYLKSLSVLCKSDTFDNLCDSLCSNEGTKFNK